MKPLPILLLVGLLIWSMPTDSQEPVMNWQTFGHYEFGAPCSDLNNPDDWQEVIGKDGVVRKECRELDVKKIRKGR